MLALRLGIRLLRGGGQAGRSRLVLMVLGIGFGVLAVLLALAAPRALQAGAERVMDRFVVVAGDTDRATFRFAFLRDDLGDRYWTRVLVADVSDSAEPPPGIAALPAPGTAYLSPAAAAANRAAGVTLAGEQVVGVVGPAGLREPGELIEYVGVEVDQLPGGGQHGAGFGRPLPTSRTLPVTPATALLIMTLLVLLPAAVYLSACAQLSSASRGRRIAGLRLLGLEPHQAARAAGVESAVLGAAGSLVGLALYASASQILASRYAPGVEVYSTDIRLTPTIAVAVIAATTVVAYGLGRWASHRVLMRPLQARHDTTDNRASWWPLAPLVVGSGLLLPLGFLPLINPRWRMTGPDGATLLLVGGGLALIGLMLSLRVITVGLARGLAASPRSLPMRLAARRLMFEPASATRVLTGLVLLVVLASVGAAVSRDVLLVTTARTPGQAVELLASDLPDQQSRAEVFDVPSEHRFAIIPALGGVDIAPPGNYGEVLVGTCADARAFFEAPLAGCRDGSSFRLVDPAPANPDPVPALVPGTQLRTTEADLTVDIPQTAIEVPGAQRTTATTAVLVTDVASIAIEWPTSTRFALQVPTTLAALTKVRAGVHEVAPGARMALRFGNTDGREAVTFQRGLAVIGLGLGFGLAALAFIISTIDRAMERRRNVALLLVIGLPRTLLRRAQDLQALIPLAVVLTAALVVGQLISQAYLAGSGNQEGYYFEGLLLGIAMVAVATGLAVLGSRLTPGAQRLDPEYLRRE